MTDKHIIPCPKCGKSNLQFMTMIDCLNSSKDNGIKTIASIVCLNCFFQMSTREIDVGKNVVDINKKRWYNLYCREKKLRQ